MSRSRRKTSSRRKDSSDQAQTVRREMMPDGRGAEQGNAAAPSRSTDMALPVGPRPGRPTGQGGSVSRTVCALCCLVCLLAGMLLGNLLPHMRRGASADDRASAAGAAEAPHVVAPAAETGVGAAPAGSPAAQKVQQGITAGGTGPVSPELQHIAHLEQALQQHPDDAARWTELGNAYFDTGQPFKAIEAYKRSLRLQPNNPGVLTDLGIMYRESGQYEQALESFDMAIRRKPDHEQARFNKGVVLLFDLHRHAEAKAVWQELLGINPSATAPDGTSLRDLIRQCDKPLPQRLK